MPFMFSVEELCNIGFDTIWLKDCEIEVSTIFNHLSQEGPAYETKVAVKRNGEIVSSRIIKKYWAKAIAQQGHIKAVTICASESVEKMLTSNV